MRKYIICCLLIPILCVITAWGYKGHRTIAIIAQNHLTPQAKAAVKDLLGSESLADVSTWADEVRSDAAYRNTASWHFLNVPAGLTYEQFTRAVFSMSNENLHTAISNAANTLADSKTTKEQKREALKFLVHFVGDAHQPMHVSRAEDKGGNTIQVRFNNKETNLHSLWDSGLIEHTGLSESQLIEKIEKQIKPSDLKVYARVKPMEWLYESYNASTLLYKGIQQNSNLDDKYYASNIGLAEERLGAAGMRLAAILNDIFKNEAISAAPVVQITNDTTNYRAAEPVININLSNVSKYVGKLVSLEGRVYSTKDMGSMVLVNLGAAYPNQLLTVVLKGQAKAKIKDVDSFVLAVKGKVVEFKGKPQITVSNENDITVTPIVEEKQEKKNLFRLLNN